MAAKKPVEKEQNEVRAIVEAEKTDPIISKFASEDRTRGNISFGVIATFIRKAGGFPLFIAIFSISIFAQYIQLMTTQYLIIWSKEYTEDDRWVKFGIYAGLNYTFIFLNVFRFIILLILGIRASRRTHSSMVFRLLHAPVEEFIEKVSAGRLINRFSKDLDVLDKTVFKSSTMVIFTTCIVIIDAVFMVF